VPVVLRVLVWAAALPAGLLAVALPLRAAGILDVNQAIDLFAGAGIGRFIVLLLMLPLWAAVSATLAHLVLEAIARRRRSGRPAEPQLR
jgi:hypothetical protein